MDWSLQAEIGIKEKAELLVSRVRKQEVELLRELREKRDQKLERLMKETETVNFYIAKAHSLQVSETHSQWVLHLQVMPCYSCIVSWYFVSDIGPNRRLTRLASF